LKILVVAAAAAAAAARSSNPRLLVADARSNHNQSYRLHRSLWDGFKRSHD